MEEYRNGHKPDETYTSAGGKPEGIPTEMADVVIRIMDMAGYYGIDLEQAIIDKIKYNKTRPYKHGGKVI
jgi:NTP pyrophosphatase (non-canonical NTP hydrolase)